MNHRLLPFVMLAAAALVPAGGRALVFYSSGDPAFNTNAPAGALTNSGWQFVGTFNFTVGVPVSPHHFLVCQHWNGNVGDPFVYRGASYKTVQRIDDAASDLTLFRVEGSFPAYAPLYTGTAEVGKDVVVHGRGADRGTIVTTTNIAGQVSTNGWRWGAFNHVLRWGENTVEGTTTIDGNPVLRCDFDFGAETNEAMATGQDSGGPAFLLDGSTWKLAGLNYSVGPMTFSYESTGSNAFNAALYQYRRLYYLSGTNWIYQSTSASCSFYLTRVSSRYAWITNQIPDFDRDYDGLPDFWEERYGVEATAMSPTADGDGDGQDNLSEYTADTVPTNAVSVFRLTGLAAAGSNALSFAGSTGRQYRVGFNDSAGLDTGGWLSDPSGWRAGAGNPTWLTVSNAPPDGGRRMFRVDARVP